MFNFTLLNIWVWLGTAALGVAIGCIWHSPLLFRNVYLKAKDMPRIDCKSKNLWKSLLGQFLSNLIIAYVLFGVFMLGLVFNMQDALMLVSWLWLGFMATISFSNMAWSPKKNITVFFLDAALNLVLVLAMGAVLFQFGLM